ncbi:MAG: leucine-rich repeat protein [Lachnospiraceae bacterium]|nr:leucine-rich repeat protein [Lachnospiraceae bacterium]
MFNTIKRSAGMLFHALLITFGFFALLPATLTLADDMIPGQSGILTASEEEGKRYCLDEMLSMDWRAMSDAKKDDVIFNSDSGDLMLLIAAAGDMKDDILNAPYMSQVTTVYEYDTDESGKEICLENRMSYADYLTEYLPSDRQKANWKTSGSTQIVYHKMTLGYYGGAPYGGSSYTIKLDFTSSGGDYNSMSKVILKSVTGNSGAGFSPATGIYDLKKNMAGNLVVAHIPITLSNLSGYVYLSSSGAPFDSTNTAELSAGGGITGNVASYTVYWHFNLWQNSSLGKDGTATPTYRLTLAPAANVVYYDSAGGLSTPSPVTFGYYEGTIVAAAVSKNPIVYNVTLDAAGGNATDTSLSSTRNFIFQHWIRPDGALYSAGQIMPGFGGQGAATTLTAVWSDSGQQAVTLPQASRKGYDFAGWTGPGISQAPGSAFIPSDNTTLTAAWNPISYTVSFDPDGGTQPEIITAVYDQAFNLPESEKTGYILKGWSGAGLFARTGEVTNLTDSANSEVSLSAVWEPIKYTISFDANGGTDIEDVVCTYNEPFTLPLTSREDYAFAGWEDEEGNIITIAQNLTCENEGQIHLKAIWTATTVIVSFDADGGTEVNDVKYTIGEPAALPDTVRTGYIFKGWTDASGKTYTTAQDIVSETGTLTLKAIWEPEPTVPPADPGNIPGLNDEQMLKILQALEAGSITGVTIDGIEYTIYKNPDGSLTIKLADPGNSQSIVIPGEITIGGKSFPVTEIEKGCFKNNTTIKEVTLGSRVIRIGDEAFSGCSALERVSLGQSLMYIGDKAFYGCRSLKSITFPDTLKSIGNSAFEGCTSLAKINLNSGLLSVGNRAFFGCSGATSLFISKTVLKIGKLAFSECTALKTVKSQAGSQLVNLGNKVFYKDTALTKVSLGDKFTTMPAAVFSGCRSLKTLKGAKGITKIGTEAFADCSALKKITLPSKLHKIGAKAFIDCKLLKKVSIKSKNLTSVGSRAFTGCGKGIRFSVPKAKTSTYARLMKGKY